MIRYYGDNLTLGESEQGEATATLEFLPERTLDAIETLLPEWPALVTAYGPYDAPDCPLKIQRGPGRLTVALPGDCRSLGELSHHPVVIAARFERLAEFFASFSEQIRLRQLKNTPSAILDFDLHEMGESISEAVQRLDLKSTRTERMATTMCIQLSAIFQVRTVGQLVLWLAMVLEPEQQTVSDAVNKAVIDSFWRWADPNALYLIYDLLAIKQVVLSDLAFFLYFTKLSTKLDDLDSFGTHDVDARGRLRLPLLSERYANIVPKRWITRMVKLAEGAKVRLGAEMLSDKTEPSLWVSTKLME